MTGEVKDYLQTRELYAGSTDFITFGSPIERGQFIQCGSAKTAAGKVDILFGTTFADTNYVFVATPGSTASAAGVQGVLGSMQPVISGLRLDSGLVMYGGPTQLYDWIAIGRV